MKNLISVSTAPIAGFGDKEYYDLLGTIDLMKKVFGESVVDGFELQLEPEWNRENAPLTDADWADWKKTPKFTAAEVVELVRSASLPTCRFMQAETLEAIFALETSETGRKENMSCMMRC